MSDDAARLGWSVTRLGPACGARVDGPCLAGGLEDAEAEVLAELLAEHLVLALPGQHVDPATQVRLGKRFGEPYVHPFLTAIDGHPEVLEVLKEPDDAATFGGEFWHADITYEDPPSSVSLLQAVELPPLGGDTLFANQFLAYETLSPGLRRILDDLDAVHLYPGMAEDDRGAMSTHPVVRTHPVTGRRALFVNAAFTTRFAGMTERESRPLLGMLFAHQTRHELVTRVGWAEGQLTIWDNRAVQHYAMNDYPGRRRSLRRVTVMERPLRTGSPVGP